MTKALNIGIVRYSPWDPKKSLDFLVNVLGFYPQLRGDPTKSLDFLVNVHDAYEYHRPDKIFVGCGETLIEFCRSLPGAEAVAQDPDVYGFGVVVPSLDATLAEAESHGAKVVRPIWNGNSFWGRQVVIDAPGGPHISLREYREPDSPHFDGWHDERTPSPDESQSMAPRDISRPSLAAKAMNIGIVRYSPWDPKKSLDFFTSALGFYPQLRGDKVFVGCGDTLIQFYEATTGVVAVAQDPNTYAFGVVVSNLDETLAEVEPYGAKVVRPIWNGNTFWGRQVVIDAPGGPNISLREYWDPDGPHFGGWHRIDSSS